MQSFKTLTALLLVALLAHVLADTSKFNVADALKGEWEIEFTQTSTEVPESPHEKGKFFFDPGFDNVMIGNFSLGENMVNEFRIEVESPRTGVFRFLKPSSKAADAETADFNEDTESSPTTGSQTELEFKFNFVPTTDAFSLMVAQDIYQRGNVTGVYQFTAANAFFILTFTEMTNEGNKIQYSMRRFLGKKKGSEPGFFSKFGPPLLIALFFFGSKLFAGRMTPQQGAAPAAAAAEAVPAARTKQE